MSTIAIKLTSLAIRTLAKPIANSIKQQAKEHENFRRLCINIAQAVHRMDMRIRLNLLRDSSVIAKQELAEEEKKKAEAKGASDAAKSSIAEQALDASKKVESPILKAVSEQNSSSKEESSSSSSSTHHSASHSPPIPPSPKKKSTTFHIRPLSDAKAIEQGANFISEAFLFTVAGGLILFETIRSRKKESNRRDEVTERLQNLEEVDEMWRKKVEMLERRLDEAGIQRVPELLLPESKTPPPEAKRWFTWIPDIISREPSPPSQPPQESTHPPSPTIAVTVAPASGASQVASTSGNSSDAVATTPAKP